MPRYFLILVTISILFFTVVLPVQSAWDAPSANPPDDNTYKPINQGDTMQVKNGTFWLGGDNYTANSGDWSFLVEKGRVGIGTTSPGAELDLVNTTSTQPIFIASDDTGTELLRIHSNGNVGISSSTPNYDLTVNGYGYFAQPVVVGTPTADTHATTKSYVDSELQNATTTAENTYVNESGDTMTGALDMTGNDIKTLGNLTTSGDLGITGGNVGIGTTSPGQDLHVESNDVGIRLKRSDITETWDIEATGEGLTFKDVESGDNPVTFQHTAPTDSLYLDNTGEFYITGGNVGIGTTSPGAELDLVNTTSTQPIFTASDDTGTELVRIHSNGNVGISSSTPNYDLTVNGYGYFAQPVVVGTPTKDTHATTKSYVDSTITTEVGSSTFWTLSGIDLYPASTTYDVGIGTSTPSYKLDVGGDINLTGTLYQNGSEMQTGYWEQSDSNVYYNTGNVGIGTIGPGAGLDLVNATNTQPTFTASDDTGTELIRIQNDGNVGIGTTSPAYALDVAGYGQFSQPVTVGTPTADTHATTKSYVDSELAEATSTAENTYVNEAGDTMTGALDMDSNNVLNGSICPDGTCDVNNYETFAANGIGTTNIYDGSGGEVNFQSQVNFNSNNVKFPGSGIWNSSGDLGIGTTTPSYALDVVGYGQFSQPVTVGTPTADTHATTKSYVDSELQNATTTAENTYVNESGDTMTGALDIQQPDTGDIFNVSSSTAGDLMTITNEGNVGIGTTSPAAGNKIHVEGQCVTGDTLLSVVENNEQQDVESSKFKVESKKVPIKDVKQGTYVYSLNQKTGKLMPAKIKGLLDMGKKPIYEIETEDGRTIRTTGNHPYLVRYSSLREDDSTLSGRNITNLSLNLEGSNLSNKEKDLINALASFWGIFSQTTAKTFPAEYSAKSLSLVTKTLSSFNDNLASFSSDTPLEARTTSTPFVLRDLYNSIRTFSSNKNLNFKQDIIFASSEVSSVSKSGLDMLFGQRRECLENILNRSSVFQHIQNLPNHNPSSLEARLSMADTWVSDNILIDSNFSPTHSNFNDNSDTNILSTSRWTRVAELNEGDQIAVAKLGKTPGVKEQSGETPSVEESFDAVKFVKIKRITNLPSEQQVYDIEVQGTHNFVANGIIAHNTYLSSNVGIGTTSPSYALDVAGYGQFAQPVTVGTPTADTHATTKSYVDSELQNATTTAENTYVNESGDTMSGALNMDSNDIKTLGNLTTSGDMGITGGNVGIGTTTPNWLLSVGDYFGVKSGGNFEVPDNVAFSEYNAGSYATIKTKGINIGLSTNDSVSYGEIESTADRDLHFNIDGSEKMTILDTGNVGIGTTGPGAGLDLVNVTNTQPTFTASDDTGTELVRIQNDGNVGIGTTSPAYALDVAGYGQFSQPVTVGTPTADTHATTKSYVDSSVSETSDLFWGVISLDTGDYKTSEGASGTVVIPGVAVTNCDGPACIKNFGDNRWQFEFDTGSWSQIGFDPSDMPGSPLCWGTSMGDNETVDGWGWGIKSVITDANGHCLGQTDCATASVYSEADSHDTYGIVCQIFH